MTLVTIHAVVDISTYVRVVEVGSVIVAVATGALKHGVIAGIRMASRADPVRVAVIHREVRVIERRSRPRRCRVAGGAGGREPGRRVIRIRRSVVVALVAAHARGRQRRVVIVDVAHHAGDRRSRMEACQRERRVVVIKGCARPVGRAVAGVASRREAGRSMRRRVRIVVVGLVARNAGRVRRRQIVVPVHVALAALHRGMEAGEREARGRVVERPVAPVGGGMALVASLREASRNVIRSSRALEIL